MKLTDLQLDEKLNLPYIYRFGKAKITTAQIKQAFHDLREFFLNSKLTTKNGRLRLWSQRDRLGKEAREIIERTTGFRFHVILTPKDFGSAAGYARRRKWLLFKEFVLLVHLPAELKYDAPPEKLATVFASAIIHELTHHIQHEQKRSKELPDAYDSAVERIRAGNPSREDQLVYYADQDEIEAYAVQAGHIIAYKNGNRNEAIKELRRLIEVNPEEEQTDPHSVDGVFKLYKIVAAALDQTIFHKFARTVLRVIEGYFQNTHYDERMTEALDKRREYFMRGGCYALAFTLNEYTGFPIYVLVDREGDWHHALVVDEANKKALDARGWQPLKINVLAQGMAGEPPITLRKVTPEELRVYLDRVGVGVTKDQLAKAKKFTPTLTEMAPPPDSMKTQRYYHGVNKKDQADFILKNGITPPDKPQGKGHMAPVAGRVYLTPRLDYGVIYALGGDVAGHSMPEEWIAKEPYGYLFVVDGKDIQGDVQPDEDAVGQILSYALRGQNQPNPEFYEPEEYRRLYDVLHDQNLISELVLFAQRFLTPNQIRKIKMSEYREWARSGKTLLKKLPDWVKTKLIHYGTHVAHQGQIQPIEMWRIDKHRSAELKTRRNPKGVDFFQIAEKVWERPQQIQEKLDIGVPKDGLLYRWVNARKAISNMQTNSLYPGKWKHDIPGVGKVAGISFGYDVKNWDPMDRDNICFVVDRTKLNAKKFVDMPGDAVYHYTQHGPGIRLDKNYRDLQAYIDDIDTKEHTEAFYVGIIRPLDQALKAIIVHPRAPEALKRHVMAYATPRQIPVQVKQSYAIKPSDLTEARARYKTYWINKGTPLYHGTGDPDWSEGRDYTNGPFWVRDGRDVAKKFKNWHDYGEDQSPRVTVWKTTRRLKMVLLDRNTIDEIEYENGIEGGTVQELAEVVCRMGYDGWAIPDNYPEGGDFMVCQPNETLSYVETLAESLTETREAPLYHWMDIAKAYNVFAQDEIRPQWEHVDPLTDKTLTGTSFSRNPSSPERDSHVRITVDQRRLSQTNKIIPLDAERVHHYSYRFMDFPDDPRQRQYAKRVMKGNTLKDRNMHKDWGKQWAEEFVLGKIKPLHNYITGIVITDDRHISAKSRETVLAYAKKWNIPVQDVTTQELNKGGHPFRRKTPPKPMAAESLTEARPAVTIEHFMEAMEQVAPYDENVAGFLSQNPRGYIRVSESPYPRAVEIAGVGAIDPKGGQNILGLACKVADQLKMGLSVHASPLATPFRPAGDLDTLADFYGAFGFQPDSDRDEEWDFNGMHMYRSPNASNQINEVHYQDIYPAKFETFHKKYRTLIRKREIYPNSYYVQFRNYADNQLDRTAYENPDHTDPMGVYTYPLNYVLKHPADIWYGTSARYLRVIEATPKRALYLKDLNNMGFSYIRNILWRLGMDRSDRTMRKIKKNFGYKGKLAPIQTFMRFMQLNLEAEPTKKSGWGYNRYEWPMRTAKEQNALFLKAGYDMIIDEGTGAINEREPEQAVFLTRKSFRVVDVFDLRPGRDVEYMNRPDVNDDSVLIRKFAQMLAVAIDDKIADGPETAELMGARYFWTKNGRRIEIDMRRPSRFYDHRIGEKLHKYDKKTTDHTIDVKIRTEFGDITTFNYHDGERLQEIANRVAEKYDHLKRREASTTWTPMSRALYKEERAREKELSTVNYMRKREGMPPMRWEEWKAQEAQGINPLGVTYKKAAMLDKKRSWQIINKALKDEGKPTIPTFKQYLDWEAKNDALEAEGKPTLSVAEYMGVAAQ